MATVRLRGNSCSIGEGMIIRYCAGDHMAKAAVNGWRFKQEQVREVSKEEFSRLLERNNCAGFGGDDE